VWNSRSNRSVGAAERPDVPAAKRSEVTGVCLAVPAKVIRIDGSRARVDAAGNVREADLTLLPDVKVGEYVLLHAGFAIGRYDEETALATLRDLEQIARLAAEDGIGP
jgi:hydrogenase expression/formation protein HypC